MHSAPPYTSDQLPGDFTAALVTGVSLALVSGITVWYACRMYLLRTYPAHPELLSAATVAGIVDGALFGVGGAIAAVALRIWRREREERRRSDTLLRLELDSLRRDSGPRRQRG